MLPRNDLVGSGHDGRGFGCVLQFQRVVDAGR